MEFSWENWIMEKPLTNLKKTLRNDHDKIPKNSVFFAFYGLVLSQMR